MKIGIDIRCLVEGRRTGIEEYTLNLLSNLFAMDNTNQYVLFLNSWKEPEVELDWIKKYPQVELKRFRIPNKLLNFAFWYLNWPKIDRLIGGVDIFFFPNIIFASISQKVKMITTFHDLSFESYPETFSWKRRLWHLFINPKKMACRSDRLIAVSSSTKNDLVSYYGIEPAKISVIHSGISGKFRPIDRNDSGMIKVKEKYKLPFRFVLYLGTIEPRKNISALIRAFDQLQAYAAQAEAVDLQKYQLIIAGQRGWLYQETFDEILQANYSKKIHFIDYVADADKEYLISLAAVFVYPSLFEGFGFPPLEAMACGVPVITSNNSSLPEVVGQAGILISPDKPDEIYRALREILLTKELHASFRQAGLDRSRQFNWQNNAGEFIKLINKL